MHMMRKCCYQHSRGNTITTNLGCSDDVWVCPINIGVGMVAYDMLVDPCIHGSTVEEIMDTTNSLPHPRLVGDSKMAAGKLGEGQKDSLREGRTV